MRFLVAFLLIANCLSAQTYSKGTFKHGDSLFWGSGLGDSIFTPSNNQTAVIVRDSSKFQTTLSVGTPYTTSPLTVTNFTTSFPTPQVGTMFHLVSNGTTNGRLSFDTYNNTSFTGSNYQGRRARGTAGTPLPVQSDDILVAIGADGFGVDSFTNTSVGSMNIRSEATFTNTSKPTYVAFTTTPSGSTTQVERMRIKSTGVVNIAGLNSVGFVQTDANGNLSTSTSGANLTGLTATQVGLGNVTNESKATMFTNATFTGTFTVPSSVITNANLAGSITEAKFGFTDITTANASTSAHGLMPKWSGSTTTFFRSDGTQATPTGVNSSITFLGADVTNNNAVANTIADVTGLSFAVTSGVTYRFKFFVVYTSAATTTGSRWAISGPSTTFVNYNSNYTLTATSQTVNSGVSAYDIPAASSASSLAAGNIAIVEGIIKPSANGTVILRFASEISNSAIVAKANQSYVEFQAIN